MSHSACVLSRQGSERHPPITCKHALLAAVLLPQRVSHRRACVARIQIRRHAGAEILEPEALLHLTERAGTPQSTAGVNVSTSVGRPTRGERHGVGIGAESAGSPAAATAAAAVASRAVVVALPSLRFGERRAGS